MPRALAVLLIFLLSLGTAHADFLLVPETHIVKPGGQVNVTLFLPNDSSEERLVDLPVRITLRARGLQNAPEIALSPADPDQPANVRIAPGAFYRGKYAGTLPDALTGNLVLELVEFEGPPMALAVADPEEAAPVAGAAAPATATQEKDAKTAQKQEVAAEAVGPTDRDAARFASAFSPNEPNYFVAGSSGQTNAKFQVSLKFRLFNPDTSTPFLEKLYLAYSQTSIWELGSSSKPFYDSSYRPSAFFLDDDIGQWPFRKWSRLGIQTGIEHESNGKDAADSRSMNTVFVRPTFTLPLRKDYFISFSPKIYGYTEKEDNPDIAEYRGYGDYLIKIGQIDGLQLATTLRKGTAKDPYSAQFDLSYPLKTATFGNLGGYLHLQFFEGYGESLLDYNRHVRPQFRIGLMITR
jgi:outer membrane phospholipase A